MTFIRDYLRELSLPPAPLTRIQRLTMWIAFVIAAASRFLALSKGPLDWDEALFCSATREYDVVPHNPHPPGYPLFILAAKIFKLVLRNEFRSLQAVATLAAILLFPAIFKLCRELRFRFGASLAAAIIGAFLPTIWYYGGTALSDVPALCAVIAASALLLNGGRSDRAFVAGMFLLGIAGGIRPQHVIIALPALLAGAAANRRPRTIAYGLLACTLVVSASYAGAAFSSSGAPRGYIDEVRDTAKHIHDTDSYHNPMRIPLRDLVEKFFVSPHRGGYAGKALFILAMAGALDGLIRRRAAVLLVLLMFVPTAIMSWLMFDVTGLTRYAVAYVLLYVLCGVAAIDGLLQLIPHAIARDTAVVVVAIVFAISFGRWTWPALKMVRRQRPPPAEALRWVSMHVPPIGTQLFLSDNLGYHAQYRLAGYDMSFFSDYKQIPDEAYRAGNYCLVEHVTVQPYAHLWRYPRKRLAEISRTSYYEVSVIPMNAMVRFGDGWYGDEYTEDTQWKWMGQKSVMLLPPLPTTGQLHIKAFVPVNDMPHRPTIKLTWNGEVIENDLAKEDFDRKWVLPSRPDAANELRIELDAVSRPREKGLTTDTRDFGLQLFGIAWERTDGVKYGM